MGLEVLVDESLDRLRYQGLIPTQVGIELAHYGIYIGQILTRIGMDLARFSTSHRPNFSFASALFEYLDSKV